jgi:type I restriction enzyme, R subunit
MADLSEKETRNQIIDLILERVGWSKEYIVEEPNAVKSNFKTGEFKFIKDETEEGENRFIDYLLLDERRKPVAIIEAKRTSADIEKGEIQGRTYREDVEKQIGFKIPVFLTNGNEWYYISPNENERDVRRKVLLPFSQKDLHRIMSLQKKRKDPSRVKLNSKIVNRKRSIEAVKQVLEHFNEGKRSALINMATGTGKTRVAMAIIDGLKKADYIQNILFVVDRTALANQAKEKGFKKFFPNDPVTELNEEGFSDTARIYVSTIQTLMVDKKPRGKLYEKFGTGFFDLIIFDEAHRSIYDKNNDVMKYFDALKIGLTATPLTEDIRETTTFRLFGCEEGKPTVRYDYDQAVRDDVLAPYVAEVIETKVLSQGIEGKKLSKELKFALEKQEEKPEEFQTPGSKFEKFFTDEKTNELIVSEFMDRCYKSGGRPCKTIFFCASVKHAESLELIFQKLYPMLAKDVKVIVSNRARYMDEVKRFEKKDFPRIALSVGVLDTGIDIPEIMNLVFVKPVMSKVRFWQMLGRGTRNLKACEHRDWLPDGKKNDFYIMDFKFGDFSNIHYWGLDPKMKKSSGQDKKVKIFEERLDLLEKDLDEAEKEIVEKQIRETIKDIDVESPLVLEKKEMIKKVVSVKFDLAKHIEKLKTEISPLLIYSKSENQKVYAFIGNCVKLFNYLKEDNLEGIEKVKRKIVGRAKVIWDKNLEVILAKRDDLIKIQGDEYWENLTFEDVDFLIREIAPLMIYYEVPRKGLLKVNAPDVTIGVEQVKKEVGKDPEFEEFIKSSPLMVKIKNGEGVTSKELLEIEEALRKKNSRLTIENIQEREDFVLFLRALIDVKGLPDPKEMIKWEFDKHVIDRNEHYNSEQLKFLRNLEEVFVRAKHIELKSFAEHPLKEARPLDIFSKEQLVKVVEKCNGLKWK